MSRNWVGRLLAVALVAVLLGACTDDAADTPETTDIPETTDVTDLTDPEFPLPPVPDIDLSVDDDGGVLVAHSWDHEVSAQMWSIVLPDGEPVEQPVEGFEGVNALALAPDGTTIAGLGWLPGSDLYRHSLLVGTLDDGFEPLFEDDDLDMWCIRWHPSGDRIYLTSFLEGETSPVLLSVPLEGEPTQIVVPAGRYECAIPIDDNRVALTYIGEGIDVVGIVVVDLEAEDADVLFEKEGCLLYGPTLSPDATEIVLSASCEVPTDSGVHIVAIETGEVDHVFAGEVGYPTFSPSGQWIAFGLYPTPDSVDSRIYAIHRDGTGFRQFTEMEAGQPLWLVTR